MHRRRVEALTLLDRSTDEAAAHVQLVVAQRRQKFSAALSLEHPSTAGRRSKH